MSNVAFVVGTGRCGTQFLSRVLELETSVASVHERNPFNETFHRYCKWYGVPVDHEGFLEAKEKEIQADLNRCSFSIESSAHLSLSIQELYERFNAKFVLLVRRPDQVVNSYRYKGWYSEAIIRTHSHLPPSYQESREPHHFLGRIVPSGETFDRWQELTQVGKLAWYWSALNNEVIEQFSAIPREHWRIQKLENLSYSSYLEIAEFIGFPSNVSRTEYQQITERRPNAKNSKLVQKQTDENSGKKRSSLFTVDTWNHTEIAEFESEVADVATRLGYSHSVAVLQQDSREQKSDRHATKLDKSTDPILSASNSTLTASTAKTPTAKTKAAKIEDLIYISNGNLPSKMAHTIQVAKMSQALSKQIKSFALITGGDIISAIRGMDEVFKDWYGIRTPFNLMRLPVHRKVEYPFPADYASRAFCRFASLYTYLKYPALVYTRSPQVVDFMLALQVPVLWESHEPLPTPFTDKLVDRLTHKDLVGFVTLSEEVARNYVHAGLSSEKVLIAHSGVDLGNLLPHQEKHVAQTKLALSPDKKIILYSGHLYEYKGIPTLIETARLLPECRFILVGGWQEDIDRTRELCEQKGVDNVSLIGHVEQSALATYLYAADVLVIPNSRSWKLANTTSPLKLFEYMAVKRPIVASALPNITTVLNDRENALLAEPDNPDSFKDAIAKLLADPDLAEQIASRAAEDVQQYTWEKRAGRVLEFANEQLRQMKRSHHTFIYRILVVLKILIFH
ncbi:MAG: glycosyltransferase family 4 protein [Cyanobacteria bacterium P01_D01_bin.1]